MNEKGGLHEKKKHSLAHRIIGKLLRLGLAYVRFCKSNVYMMLRLLEIKHERVFYVLYTFFYCLLVSLPVPLAWGLLAYLLGIPNDIVRFFLIWGFFFLLVFLDAVKGYVSLSWKDALDKYGA